MMATNSLESTTTTVLEQLERDGVAVLSGFIQGEQLAGMQRAFESRLQRMRWNYFEGYERTERFRHMVEDVLVLDQGFVDIAIHPLVKETLRTYIGPNYELVEAKGWKSLPTRRHFHGWHADAWYDQTKASAIAREIKLGVYLTDVETGAFGYIKGTHRQYHPRIWKDHEIDALKASQIVRVLGKAGTAFLFDTTGIHGQSCPILEPRQAVFYNYHDPSVPLEQENIDNYRYHPLALNAALLGNLTSEDQRILGFGNKTNYTPAFVPHPNYSMFQAVSRHIFDTKILADDFLSRVSARLKRYF